MVWHTELVAPDLGDGTRAVLRGTEYIGRGIDTILLSLAVNILDGRVALSGKASSDLVNITLDSVSEAMLRHRNAFPFNRLDSGSLPLLGLKPVTRELARLYLEKFFLDALRLPELLDGVSLIMIAGQQGSGKDSLLPVLENLGYVGTPMSAAVQDVASAWGANRTSTIDKITVGKKLKEIFGQGILVPVTVARMAASGEKKIVMLGPRVMEEVDAALNLNGLLVGIAADSDYTVDRQIRRNRIVQRQLRDPTRASDVKEFDQREKIEGDVIAKILNHPACHLFVDNSPLDDFRMKFRDFILLLLK